MAPPSEDELLSTAGMPGWVRWTAGLGAIAILVALLIMKAKSRSDDPTPTPTPTAGPSSTLPPVTIPPLPIADANPVRLPIASPVDDVVTAVDMTWVLQRHTLLRLDHGRSKAVTASGVEPDNGQPRLILDTANRQVWLVALGAAPTILQSFQMQTLQPLAAATWSRPVTAAAALDGSLYFVDPAGLYRLDSDSSATPIDLPRGQRVVDLAADPVHSRLLALVGGSPLRIAVLDEHGLAVSRATTPLVQGRLTVTGSGQIWVAGFGQAGPVLARLDPTTLGTVATSPLIDRIGPGALLVASGTDSLLITPGNSTTALWCIDARSGAPVQRWGLRPDQAATSHGTAYATSRGGLFRLDLTAGCTG